MKYLLISFIFFFFLSCKKKELFDQNDGQIKIISNYCKYGNLDNYLKPEFRLFKDNREKTEITISKEDKEVIIDLPFGDYVLEYKTIFNQKNRIEFSVSDRKLKEITVCVDFLDYKSNKNILLLEELKTEQSLIFSFKSQGCFDSHSDEIKILKAEKKFIAVYKDANYNLSESQINLLKEFEIELRSNHIAGCSRIDNYGIMNEQTLELYVVNDESCLWKGFDNLIELLDLKK